MENAFNPLEILTVLTFHHCKPSALQIVKQCSNQETGKKESMLEAMLSHQHLMKMPTVFQRWKKETSVCDLFLLKLFKVDKFGLLCNQAPQLDIGGKKTTLIGMKKWGCGWSLSSPDCSVSLNQSPKTGSEMKFMFTSSLILPYHREITCWIPMTPHPSVTGSQNWPCSLREKRCHILFLPPVKHSDASQLQVSWELGIDYIVFSSKCVGGQMNEWPHDLGWLSCVSGVRVLDHNLNRL